MHILSTAIQRQTHVVWLTAILTSAASGTIPYGGVTPGTPGLGPMVSEPPTIPGKEFSHNFDHGIDAVGVFPFPEQVVAWDGSGGVANGINYTGTRPDFTLLSEVDALAHRNDALFNSLLLDQSHLIFSVDDTAFSIFPGGGAFPVTVPSTGPIQLANGNSIGGAGELSYELATGGPALGNPVNVQGIWARQEEINGMPLPGDIDAVELWGPEPGFTADADKYSLDVDSNSSFLPGGPISVWNLSGSGYIRHQLILNAVTGNLGPLPADILPEQVNVDALMVRDTADDPDVFQRDLNNPGDVEEIIFSIRQLPDTTDPAGYYATGSELFVLSASGLSGFLPHGGHVWNKDWALANMAADIVVDPNTIVRVPLDLNALESVGASVVPEPGGSLLALFGLAAFARRWSRIAVASV